MNLHSTSDHPTISGAAMDQPAPARRRGPVLAVGLLAALALLAAMLWMRAPRGLRVPLADVRIATAERTLFRDEIAVRATVQPLRAIVLDAVESGRVEGVLVRDGAQVDEGQVLFRLSNPQRRLELLQRESERAQQISNGLTLRVNLDAAQAERRRRLADQKFELDLAERRYERQRQLADQGFVSRAALQDDADHVAQLRRQYASDLASHDSQDRMRARALTQMDEANARLEKGLKLVSSGIDALAVRAPMAGRLTDFHLQVGETVSPGQHLGRIDDPSQFKLSALVDEYYLSRVATGRAGSVTVAGAAHALVVSRILPQVHDGRFTVELAFADGMPAGLQPGQSLDLSISLGDNTPALVLPNDAFVADTNGTWAFVLDADGRHARRRALRTGRRGQRQVEIAAGVAPGERVIVSSYAAFGKADTLDMTQ